MWEELDSGVLHTLPMYRLRLLWTHNLEINQRRHLVRYLCCNLSMVRNLNILQFQNLVILLSRTVWSYVCIMYLYICMYAGLKVRSCQEVERLVRLVNLLVACCRASTGLLRGALEAATPATLLDCEQGPLKVSQFGFYTFFCRHQFIVTIFMLLTIMHGTVT